MIIVIGKERFEQKDGEEEREFFKRVLQESNVHPFWFRRFQMALNEMRSNTLSVRELE